MKAAFYERTGAAAEVLQIGEMPDPLPAPGEVRVRLQWSGVNPSDVKTRAGVRSTVLPFERIVPHSDGMGVIDVVGEGVDAARIGERVWLWNAAWGRPFGTAAQFVVLPQQQAVLLPEGVPDQAGACLGIPALTALHALMVNGGVQGQSVLVAGGAGAVGYYAVQFARLLGASRVLATVSSPEKAALASAAGADAVINYRSEDLVDRVRTETRWRGVDRIVEVDLAANADLDPQLLCTGGQCVIYGSGAPKVNLPFFPLLVKNLCLQFFIVYNLSAADRARAESTLNAFLARGAVRHLIAAQLPLAQIAQAHDLVETGRAIGNVVVAVS
jgi:NADPH2:quinone reductase